MRKTTMAAVLIGLLSMTACNRGGNSGAAATTTAFPQFSVARQVSEAGLGAIEARVPLMCVEDSGIYLVWQDDRNGETDIFFNVSRDGGATWLPTAVRLDTDTAGAARSTVPQLCCVDDLIYVAWEDERNGHKEVFFNGSEDRGRTWMASDVRVTTNDPHPSTGNFFSLCCCGSNVYVVWQDDRNGAADVLLNSSRDRGKTWRADPVRVNRTPAGSSNSLQPMADCLGQTLYVVWTDARNGATDIYFNSSDDAGDTWRANDVRLDTDAPGDAASVNPRLDRTLGRVYVAWEDARGGIYAQASDDLGDTWLQDDVKLDTGSVNAALREINANGATVYVAWQDQRDGRADIYVNRSLDEGLTWLASDARVDTDAPGSAESAAPEISFRGDDVYIVWFDRRAGGETQIFGNVSRNRGATWGSTDFRISDTGASVAFGQKIFAGDDSVHLAFVSGAPGANFADPDDYRVYFTRSAR